MPLEPPLTLVLAPIDQGVRNVGGRDGACEGPERLLAGLADAGVVPDDADVRRVDAENTATSLEDDLDRLSAVVTDVLNDGRRPFVLGGDHGTTFATVRGATRSLETLGVAYLDVHLDMRPYEPDHTSGSSFRRLLEEGWVEPEQVRPLGIEVPETDEDRKRTGFDELEQWASDHRVEWTPLDRVREQGAGTALEAALGSGSWCFSLDTDVIDERWAPGVSAPGSGRLTPDEARAALTVAVERAAVLDVVEYAPRLDEDERTLETLVDVIGSALDGKG